MPLSVRAQTRQKAEKALDDLSREPNSFVPALILLATTSAQTELRQFALIVLRRKAFQPAGTDHRPLWNCMQMECQTQCRDALLNGLVREPEAHVRRKFVNTIASIVSHLLGTHTCIGVAAAAALRGWRADTVVRAAIIVYRRCARRA